MGDDIAFQALGATLNIEGGVLGDFAEVAESIVNISDGSVGDFFDAFSGSTVNISGGSVGSEFDAFSGSIVNISGGSVGSEFEAFTGSEINLFGTEFLLGGVLLDDLELGQAFTIPDRDVILSGVFADGTTFGFFLNDNRFSPSAFFSSGATLTVTQVPEPTSLAIFGLGSLVLRRRRRV